MWSSSFIHMWLCTAIAYHLPGIIMHIDIDEGQREVEIVVVQVWEFLHDIPFSIYAVMREPIVLILR